MKFKKILAVFGLIIVFCISGFYLYIQPKYVVPILMYHHIDDKGKTSSISVSPENFHNQMYFLSRYKYNVISLTELVQAIKEKERLPHNTVVITFDDGYEDNYLLAYPALKKYNLHATIFVIVDSIGKEGFLKFTQIKEMLDSGIIDIGNHSFTGAYLPDKPTQQLKQEIGTSKKILEVQLNRTIESFCYPIGGFSSQVQEIVKRNGYLVACTTNRGREQTYLNNDIFALKRIKVKDGFANLFVFWVKLSGYYNLFRSVRKPY